MGMYRTDGTFVRSTFTRHVVHIIFYYIFHYCNLKDTWMLMEEEGRNVAPTVLYFCISKIEF